MQSDELCAYSKLSKQLARVDDSVLRLKTVSHESLQEIKQLTSAILSKLQEKRQSSREQRQKREQQRKQHDVLPFEAQKIKEFVVCFPIYVI